MAEVTPFIDLTAEPKDHLTSLPPELQHIIFDFLFAQHEPDIAFSDYAASLSPHQPASHPLDFLAATCKPLRGQMMDWARHFLTRHQDITKHKPLKTAKLQSQRNFLRGRSGLLTWAEKSCVFCGKKSTRSAILMNGLRCCGACDKQQWPDKITKTEAKRKYDLKDHQILPHLEFAGKLLIRHPGGLPKLRYGTYVSTGVATTMFLRKDVVARASLVHGDLRAHLKKREADREERNRKAVAMKAAKAALAAQLPPPVRLYDEAVLKSAMMEELGRPGASVVAPIVVNDSDDELGELIADAKREAMEAGFGSEEDDHDIFAVAPHSELLWT